MLSDSDEKKFEDLHLMYYAGTSAESKAKQEIIEKRVQTRAEYGTEIGRKLAGELLEKLPVRLLFDAQLE